MELKDPTKNRKINTTPMPYQRSLSHDQLFPNDSVDYKILLKFYKREGKLSKKLYAELLKKAKHVFSISTLTQRNNRTLSRSRIPSQLWGMSTDNFTISLKSSMTIREVPFRPRSTYSLGTTSTGVASPLKCLDSSLPSR